MVRANEEVNILNNATSLGCVTCSETRFSFSICEIYNCDMKPTRSFDIRAGFLISVMSSEESDLVV